MNSFVVSWATMSLYFFIGYLSCLSCPTQHGQPVNNETWENNITCIMQLYFLLLPRLPKLPIQCYSNALGNWAILAAVKKYNLNVHFLGYANPLAPSLILCSIAFIAHKIHKKPNWYSCLQSSKATDSSPESSILFFMGNSFLLWLLFRWITWGITVQWMLFYTVYWHFYWVTRGPKSGLKEGQVKSYIMIAYIQPDEVVNLQWIVSLIEVVMLEVSLHSSFPAVNFVTHKNE